MNILIPDGEMPRIRRVVFCLSQIPGYKIHILSSNPNSHMKFSRFCYKFHCADTSDFNINRLNIILDVVQKNKIDIIFPISIPGYILLLKNKLAVQKKCRIVLSSELHYYNIALNKNLFARFCIENEVNTPKTLFIDGPEILKNITNLKFPILLKPIIGEGGIGILQFTDINSCNAYINKNLDSLKNKYILQEYIAGKEIDINVLCHEGEVLAQTILRGIFAPDRKFSFSEAIELTTNPKALCHIKPLLKRLNWSGLAHIDLIVEDKTSKIYVLEMNPRAWGTIVGSLKGGINFPHLLIKKTMELGFTNFPQKYEEIKYAAINKQILLKSILQRSEIKLSETNFSMILSDPMPTIMAKIL